MTIGSSSSSETSTQRFREYLQAFRKTSFDRTSSFFTVSPDLLTEPSRP